VNARHGGGGQNPLPLLRMVVRIEKMCEFFCSAYS
jgi:hypothetical protein